MADSELCGFCSELIIDAIEITRVRNFELRGDAKICVIVEMLDLLNDLWYCASGILRR